MGSWLSALLVGFGLWTGSGVAPAPLAAVDVVEGRVSRSGQPAAGAVVYLVRQPAGGLRGGEAPNVVTAADTVVLDQRGLMFLPSVLAVQPGTTVAFLNNDFILHNVFSPGRAIGVGDPFDLGTYSRGEMRYHTFPDQGAHTILCNVHPEMLAYVVSVPAEHSAVTDSDGRFSMGDVPSGSYRLHVWHPQSPAYEAAVRVRPDLRPLSISLQADD
ncbi:MAG: hypothetical protein ACE5FP_08590 [Gemmatimonadota bacterium]